MTVAFIGLLILVIMVKTLQILGFVLAVISTGLIANRLGFTFSKNEKATLSTNVAVGFIWLIAISQLVLVPMVMYNLSVTVATIVWWIIFLAIIVLSFIFCRNEFKDLFLGTANGVKTFFVEKRCGGVYGILATALIALQLIGSLALYHYDDDDAIYVTTVASNLQSNHFLRIYGQTGEETSLWSMSEYLTNGWYDFLTVVANSTRIHPATLMHFVLPVILLALSYTVYYVLAKLVIKKEEQRYLFFVFLSIVNILNNVSTHTSSSVLLMRIHQGKAMFANIVVPVMFCIFYVMWEEYENKKLVWMLVSANMCACAFTTSGLVFGAILTVVYGVLIAVNKRKFSLCFLTALTVMPNVIYGAIYIIQRNLEVWS